MTSLPACLPAAIAVGLVAAGVCAVLVPVGAWIDWREAQRAREAAMAGAGGPNSPRRQSGRVAAPSGPHSASCDRTTGPEAPNAPESPSGDTDPPEPHLAAPKPTDARTAPKETPMTHIHEYDRDPASNAGNCRCGLHLESHRHPHPFTQAYRSNTCVCAQPAGAPIHTDADTAQPNPRYPEPQSSNPHSFEAAREAVRQARGDDAAPAAPITWS